MVRARLWSNWPRKTTTSLVYSTKKSMRGRWQKRRTSKKKRQGKKRMGKTKSETSSLIVEYDRQTQTRARLPVLFKLVLPEQT